MRFIFMKNGKQKYSTREKIVKAALQLFFQHGFKNVSYDMLIEKTGLSKGAIYHYFPSKDNLLVSAFEFFLDSYTDQVKQQNLSGIKNISSLKEHIIKTKLEQVAGFNNLIGSDHIVSNKVLFFAEALSENKRLVNIISKVMEEELDFLYRCVLQLKPTVSAIKDKNAREWAKVLFYLLQGAEAEAFFIKDKVNKQDFKKAYVRAFNEFENLFK